jgi:hypothetical protein
MKPMVSRQRLWQFEQKLHGRCIRCGNEPLSDRSVNYCERCRLNINAYYRARRKSNPAVNQARRSENATAS